MRGILYLILIASLAPALNGCAALVAGGAAGAVVVADDRRKTGAYVDDEEIELRAWDRLRGSYPQSSVSVSVTSYNRDVLLTGQVPDDETKANIGEIVKQVPKVNKVYNELTVSGVPSLASEANDSVITSKVKARLAGSKQVSFNHVKVVTEAGVVYLMGLLTHAEADKAAEIAATTGGVVKVVKVIEYID
jgi:osmotically-inducible protein OsmY